MTNDKLKKLELNLTKSAIKAQPGAVRYKYGILEEEQGFGILDSLPLFTYKEGQKILFAEFLEDYNKLSNKHTKLAVSHASLQNEYRLYKEQETQRHLELDIKIESDGR